MALKVWKAQAGYEAEVTPPHGGGRYWKTSRTLTLAELIEALKKQGCHQQDIGDALYEADPDWLSKRDRPG